jgi:hypothetical protein
VVETDRRGKCARSGKVLEVRMARTNIKAVAAAAIAMMCGLVAMALLAGNSSRTSLLLEKDSSLSKAAGLRHMLSASVQQQHMLGSEVKALVAASQMRAARTTSLAEENDATVISDLEVRTSSDDCKRVFHLYNTHVFNCP